MVEKIRKFEKIIEDNKNSILQIMVLYNMYCHEDYKELNDRQKEILLGIIYNFYLKDETHQDLGFISDIVMENKDEILKLQDLHEYSEIKQLITENFF